MNSFPKLLLALLLILIVNAAKAQQVTDSARTQLTKDTTTYSDKDIPYKYRGAHPRIPVLAFGLSLLYPIGLGQVYNKEYGKAGVIFGTEVISGIIVISSLHINFDFDGQRHSNDHNTVGAIFVIPLVAAAIYSIVDAPISASRINRQYHLGHQRRSFSSIHLTPGIMDANASGSKQAVGFRLVLR